MFDFSGLNLNVESESILRKGRKLELVGANRSDLFCAHFKQRRTREPRERLIDVGEVSSKAVRI